MLLASYWHNTLPEGDLFLPKHFVVVPLIFIYKNIFDIVHLFGIMHEYIDQKCTECTVVKLGLQCSVTGKLWIMNGKVCGRIRSLTIPKNCTGNFMNKLKKAMKELREGIRCSDRDSRGAFRSPYALIYLVRFELC